MCGKDSYWYIYAAKSNPVKKAIVITLLCGISFMLAECSHKTTSAVSNSKETPATTVAELNRMYPPEKMKIGQALFESNCNKCHQLYDPQTRTVDDWEKILEKMIPKTDVNGDDAQLLRAYVLTNARLS